MASTWEHRGRECGRDVHRTSLGNRGLAANDLHPNRSISSAQSDRLERRHKMLATTVVMTAQLHWCAVASDLDS
ncbi:hypothetical protein IG631_10241 [Alternaria alternata]|nr:hypothetical protein IG631_10241 [Alternaria alternata]